MNAAMKRKNNNAYTEPYNLLYNFTSECHVSNLNIQMFHFRISIMQFFNYVMRKGKFRQSYNTVLNKYS